jgi:membrane protease YdiL (CAAX protease family)
VRVGILLHTATLLLLLLHTLRRLHSSDHRLWASLTLVPLIRIISLSLPLANFSLAYWFFFTSVPLFAASIVVMRLLELRRQDVGLTLRGLPIQLLIAPIGLVLGYIEYLILQPEALIGELTVQQFWWPALIITISTGLLEELIFRGILQTTAIEQMGRAIGVLYIALYFAVLHVGYRSLIDVIFVLAVGLLFGWLVLKTKSIVGVTLAHGLTNIVLFLVMPFIGAMNLLR